MTNLIQPLLKRVVEGEDLPREDAARAFQIIMNGGATPAQMAALLVALKIKGETVEEIIGAATAIRARALPFAAPEGAIDTCGTGGDASGSFNISTATALVVAACGVPVVKHGNRAVSSRSGSSDVLQALGVTPDASLEAMQQCLAEANICFLMAPNYHRAMRHVAPVRTELKLRTIFNLMGPLSNPGQVKRQLLGVYSRDLLRPLAEALLALGCEHGWVVHGHDRLDELTLTDASSVFEIRDGQLREFIVSPEDAGLARCASKDLQGGDAEHNARAMERLLAGQPSAYRDVVLLNAAAALIVAGKTQTLPEGVALAATAIDEGGAREVLNRLIALTRPAEE